MRFTEEELRKITLNAIQDLGDKASPELVKKVVANAVNKMQGDRAAVPSSKDQSTGRIILTSFGMNKPGVVASITKELSEANCDIQDISQKLMDEFFTMIMIVDITNSPKNMKEIQESLIKIADEIGFKVYLQHEDIFRKMHRI